MRGVTHLALGVATTGGIIALSPDIKPSLDLLLIGSVSSLAPDLDEPGSKLSRKLSIDVKYWKIGFIIASLGVIAYALYFFSGFDRVVYLSLGGFALIVGSTLKDQGFRQFSILFSGLVILALGFYYEYIWIYLLGFFISLSPFTTHRTWTHSLWALLLWFYIGFELEKSMDISGATITATGGYLSHLLADSITKTRVKWFFPISEKAYGFPFLSTGSEIGNHIEILITTAYIVMIVLLYFTGFRL